MAIQFLRGKTTEINQATTINLQPGQPLLDTTKGCLYINADPDDTAKKVSNPSAFTKFPSLKGTTKGFVKYDGTNYTTTADVVESIGGASGTIQLGSGLTLKNGTLSATNASSTSINGLTGEVTISGGDGVEVIKSESDRTITVSAAKVKSVTGISNEYQATDVENNLITTGWVPNASEAGFSATKKYLYVRQTTTYSDGTNSATTFLNSVWGVDGKDGTSVTILSPKYDSLEEFNSATDKKEEPGAAYLVAGDLWVWTLGQSGNPGSWQNVGRIQGPQGPKGDKGDAGATGTGATITFKYLASTSKLPSAESSDWDDDLQFARGKLSEYKPILWCQEIVNDASGTSTPKIYILETLPYKTYTRYADIGAFDTNTFQPIGTPSIYDSPKSTTGWMGIYSGYAQTAPANYEKYKWAYYLTEINRTNFMTNVIDNAKDTDGNYIDGIYTVKGNNEQNYIGINASAINTGSLKVTDGTNTIFNANISKNKVDIAGWKVSKDQISKNGVGLYSGTASTATSLADPLEATTSPIRFFAGSKDVTTVYIGTLSDDGVFTSMQEIASSYIIGVEVFSKYIKINLKESFFALYNYIRLNSTKSTITYTKADNIDKITGSGSTWKSGLFYFENQNPTALGSAVCSLYLSTDKASDWYRFKVLEDGSLYASAASIEGNINASSGYIGNFEIDPDKNKHYLKWIDEENNWNLNIGGPTGTESSPLLSISNKASSQEMRLQSNSLYFRDGETLFQNNKEYAISILTKHSIDGTKVDSTVVYPAILSDKIFIGSTNDLSTHKPTVGITMSNSGSDGTLGGTLIGTWKADNPIETSSSRNKKHDIEELDDRYSTLLDNLKAVRFKYNNDNSNCYHTGLILDEMKDAMDTAQIDSSEFAAYCVQNEETGDGGIRYDELIALLIKEIQELKRKIR